MAKESKNTTISIDAVQQTILTVELVGTSPLILNKKARSYERMEIFKQTNPKGTVIPKKYDQPYCMWERLITSLTWRDPIVLHDDDYSLYTEDEWRHYMQTNAPCILQNALVGAMAETFKTFGFKDSTGKAGTDFKRAVNFTSPKFPIKFETAMYEQKLIPNNGINKTNVVGQYNVFQNWRCEVQLVCADIVFPAETLIELISTTGKFVGVGTQRKNGYGRWEIGEVRKEKI